MHPGLLPSSLIARRIRRAWTALPALAALLAPIAALSPGTATAAEAAVAAGRCAAPLPGRYLLIGSGEASGEPVARILQETWNADGTLTGIRLERRGRTYREERYSGSLRPLSLCRVAIQRSYGVGGVSTSQAVLDLAGRPRYSIATLPDVVVASRWLPQSGAACSASLLNGSVLSMQSGRSWRDGRWQANAVIQNELWKDAQVQGIAISSYGQSIEEATYTGTIRVGSDCLATLQERDSLGVVYNYRAILLADGSGYLYLQTDPGDVTVGYLEHERAAARRFPAP